MADYDWGVSPLVGASRKKKADAGMKPLFEVGDSVTIVKGKHEGTSSSVVDVVVRTNNRKYDTTTGRYGVPYFAYKLSNVPGTIKEEQLEKFLIDPEEVDEAVQGLQALLADLQESSPGDD